MSKKLFVFFIVVATLMIALSACAGTEGPAGPAGPAGPEGPAGPAGASGSAAEASAADLSCTQCHNDTTLITGKETAWAESVHGMGEAYVRGTNASCAGCHSGGGFTARIAAGQNPTEVTEGDPNPTRQDCRACHNIHTTYTSDDFSLTTTDPVTLYALDGVTFDGGKGNLCASCHQPRTAFAAVDGMVSVTSTHWGPHHGPQSAMLLGVGGAGAVEGAPAAHAKMVEDTCVTCHLYEENHTFDPNVAVCQQCHTDAENFDIGGVQTEVEGLLDELKTALAAKGLIVSVDDDTPVVGDYPEAEAAALWNYIYIAHEDKSVGVHNPDYAKALLQASIDALK